MRAGMLTGGFATILLLAATGYAALLLVLYFYQPKLLFLPDMPSRTVIMTPADAGLDYESVTIPTSDGLSLDGWYLPKTGARSTILFFHGNAGNISHRLESLKLFHELGLSILILDYRGYGRSNGKPSEAGTYLDAEAAWRYLTEERGVPPGDIIIFGRSLGAAVATHLATRHTPGALIIESAFTSVPDMAAKLYPYLPVKLLSRIRYSTITGIGSVTCPVLIVHSRDDEIIPFSHGERIYAAAGEPRQFLEIRGGHNEGFMVSGLHYIEGLERFLQKHLPHRTNNPDR
jgi:hypothetical protein